MSSNSVSLQAVCKRYRTYSTPSHRLLELLSGGRKSYSRSVNALDDVSFDLCQGDRLGIVGENGSGKSTLLKVLSGVLTPSSGTVAVNGRIAALLELGAGFNPELTGRDNIGQFCMLHGLGKEEIDEAVPDILAFSELRDAIDHPLKTYSSGMGVRLGFACAVYVNPDILIVDEALSVGDAYFQNKCLHKIRSMLDRGISFIYVTHAADAIRTLCNRGLWLDHGRVRLADTSVEVSRQYQRWVFGRLVKAGLGSDDSGDVVASAAATATTALHVDELRQQAFAERVAPLRTGSGAARVLDMAIAEEDGEATDSLAFGALCRVQILFRVNEDLPTNTALNLGITDSTGRQITHFCSLDHGIDLSQLHPNGVYSTEYRFKSPLCPGEYGLMAGIGRLAPSPQNRGQQFIEDLADYCAGGSRFAVRWPDTAPARDMWGIVNIDAEIELTPVN